MTFYFSDEEFGTFLPLEKYDAGAILSITVSPGKAKELPPEVFSAHWLKFVMSAVTVDQDMWKLLAKS